MKIHVDKDLLPPNSQVGYLLYELKKADGIEIDDLYHLFVLDEGYYDERWHSAFRCNVSLAVIKVLIKEIKERTGLDLCSDRWQWELEDSLEMLRQGFSLPLDIGAMPNSNDKAILIMKIITLVVPQVKYEVVTETLRVGD